MENLTLAHLSVFFFLSNNAKMSCDPPKTPPAPASVKFEPKLLQSFVKLQSEYTGKKKRSSKSKTKIPHSTMPPNSDPLFQGHSFFPGYTDTQFQSYLPPPSRPFTSQPKKTKSTRQATPLTKEESLNSTMIVKKVPLINGFYNDSMVPPGMSRFSNRLLLPLIFAANLKLYSFY